MLESERNRLFYRHSSIQTVNIFLTHCFCIFLFIHFLRSPVYPCPGRRLAPFYFSLIFFFSSPCFPHPLIFFPYRFANSRTSSSFPFFVRPSLHVQSGYTHRKQSGYLQSGFEIFVRFISSFLLVSSRSGTWTCLLLPASANQINPDLSRYARKQISFFSIWNITFMYTHTSCTSIPSNKSSCILDAYFS